MVSESLAEQASELLGTAKPVTKQPKKHTIISFRDGGVFIALKAVSYYDKNRQDYDKPVAKLIFIADGKYVRFPVDSKLFGELGGFFAKLSEITKDIRPPEPICDVEYAKAMIEEIFGGKPDE